MSGERHDYAFKKTADMLKMQTQCAPPDCPSDCCQSGTPELIATWKDTLNDEFNYFFAARILFDSLEIKYGKELISCPGDSEPVCRYFLKYTIFGHYEARIDTEQILTQKRELLYLHPCWTYTPQSPSNCNLAGTVECEYNKTVIHACTDPEEVCSWPIADCCKRNQQDDTSPSDCFSNNQSFCVERIKYFDEPPSGTVVFGNGDINTPPGGDPAEHCVDPYCDTNCNNGYITEIEVRSGVPLPPYWYTNPPTKVSTTYNYLVEWDWCNHPAIGFLYNTISAPVSCCEPQTFGGRFCDQISCDSPSTTISITCEQFTDPRANILPDDPATCRLKFNWIGPAGDDECGPLPGGPGTGLASIFCNALSGSPPIVLEGDPPTNCISCFFPFNGQHETIHPACGPWIGNCITYIAAGDGSCNANCFATRTCDCFCECVPLFLDYGFFSSNTANLTTSGNWVEKVCSYTGFNLTIVLST